MTTELFLTLLGMFLSSTAVAAWIGYLTAKKRIPIEAHTAKADAAETITNSAIALSASWETRFVEVTNRVQKLEEHTREQDKALDKLRRHIDTWVTWAEGLKINWPLLRLQEEAPEPPNMKEEE